MKKEKITLTMIDYNCFEGVIYCPKEDADVPIYGEMDLSWDKEDNIIINITGCWILKNKKFIELPASKYDKEALINDLAFHPDMYDCYMAHKERLVDYDYDMFKEELH